MSIWSSLPGPCILGLNGATDAANHRGEGDPDLVVDVATTSLHTSIRLAVFEQDTTPHPGSIDIDVVLTPASARQLAAALIRAVDLVDTDALR